MSYPAPTNSLVVFTESISGIYSEEYRGTSLLVTPTECATSDGKKTYCLEVKYQVEMSPNRGSDQQAYVNRVLEQYITPFEVCLALLFTYPIKLMGYRAELDGEVVRFVSPPQRVGNLFTYGSQLHALRTSREPAYYWEQVTNEMWEMLELLLQEFQKKALADRVSLELPLHWFHKGSEEETRVDRLIALWIAFNALYEPYKTRSERLAIGACMDAILSLDAGIAERFFGRKEHEGIVQHHFCKMGRVPLVPASSIKVP